MVAEFAWCPSAASNYLGSQEICSHQDYQGSHNDYPRNHKDYVGYRQVSNIRRTLVGN